MAETIDDLIDEVETAIDWHGAEVVRADDLRKLLYHKVYPTYHCECGWSGKGREMDMDEAIEFHCPKCGTEIELDKGPDPKVVVFVHKLMPSLHKELEVK